MEAPVFYFIAQHLQSPMLDAFMLFLSEKSNWILPGGAVLAALVVVEKKRGLWFLCAALLMVGLSDLICHQVLKPWFARPRPCQELELIRFIQICSASFSFPSNHAANSFTLATLFALAYRNSILLVYSLAALVAASRVYLEVHYPTDVLAGAVCGILIGYLGYKIFGSICPPFPSRRRQKHASSYSKNPHRQVEFPG